MGIVEIRKYYIVDAIRVSLIYNIYILCEYRIYEEIYRILLIMNLIFDTIYNFFFVPFV